MALGIPGASNVSDLRFLARATKVGPIGRREELARARRDSNP